MNHRTVIVGALMAQCALCGAPAERTLRISIDGNRPRPGIKICVECLEALSHA